MKCTDCPYFVKTWIDGSCITHTDKGKCRHAKIAENVVMSDNPCRWYREEKKREGEEWKS